MPKNTKQRIRPTRRHTSRAQNAVGVSSVDNVRAVRKFMVFSKLTINNANSEYSFGVTKFNINGNGTPLADLLDDYGKLYEQYRVRRVRIRTTPGNGYTNDLRLKTYVVARVDVDAQDASGSISSLKALINAENSVTKTLIERGNILLCDFKPQCRVNTTASMPVLPNSLQFYPIGDHITHLWKGAVLGAFLPEPSLSSPIELTLSCEVDVEFRGRVTNPTLFTTEHLNQDVPPAQPDQSGTMLELKNGLLTGALFPITGFTFNIGNIGHSVTAEEALDCVYRDQSTMIKYVITIFDTENDYWGAVEEVTL